MKITKRELVKLIKEQNVNVNKNIFEYEMKQTQLGMLLSKCFHNLNEDKLAYLEAIVNQMASILRNHSFDTKKMLKFYDITDKAFGKPLRKLSGISNNIKHNTIPGNAATEKL